MICFKNNWDETLERFDAWYRQKPTDRPLISVWIKRGENEKLFPPYEEAPYDDAEDVYTNPEKRLARVMNSYGRMQKPGAEAYPNFTIDLGAGSMALYLGSEPHFTPETVWFKPFLEDYSAALPFRYDPENKWWLKHLELIKRLVKLAGETDIVINVPDIVENIDILSAIRDPQLCCLDLYDHPDEVKLALDGITKLYRVYYDAIYDIVKRPDGSSSFTAFNVIGYGKTAKLQCDFNAMMSPLHFKEFVVPTLALQCGWLDNTIFHLDGPECIVHVDALMTVERLGGLQWTTGARNPLSGDECWHGMYKKVVEAGKGLWLSLHGYKPEEAVDIAAGLVKKFGNRPFYFQMPQMDQSEYDAMMIRAEREWK